jgi:hypothetical protein
MYERLSIVLTSPHYCLLASHFTMKAYECLCFVLTQPHCCLEPVVLQDLCGGNVMLAKSATSPHGFTAKVGDFGLARINRESTAAAAGVDGAAAAAGAGAKHPVDQRLGNNEYG